MPLTLIKEDGSGKPDANAYADAPDSDSYHEGHLYASAWTAATAENKDKALVFATRLIDSQLQFSGFKRLNAQALQWPREKCPDPDRYEGFAVGMLLNRGRFLDNDKVPRPVVDATCEMARELLIADRTAAPPGEGLKYENVASNQTGYDKDDTRPVISHIAQAMLAKYCALIKSKSGMVQLIRS